MVRPRLPSLSCSTHVQKLDNVTTSIRRTAFSCAREVSRHIFLQRDVRHQFTEFNFNWRLPFQTTTNSSNVQIHKSYLK